MLYWEEDVKKCRYPKRWLYHLFNVGMFLVSQRIFCITFQNDSSMIVKEKNRLRIL